VETSAQAIEDRVEATHWWFRGRRALVARAIAGLGVAGDARVLDVGSGTGSNLRMLRDLGFRRVVGLDRSAAALRHCASKQLGGVQRADVCALPFRDASFDLVLATDVLEHVRDEARALAEIHRVLRPGGALVATVPAFMALWGRQDDVSHHLRRYRRDELVRGLAAGGFAVRRSFYFNYLLFAPIWLARRLIRWLRIEIASENELNPAWLDALLGGVFALDVRSAPLLRLPFGVSILATGHRPAAASGRA
jgi:SAM-dependent methyltransferase